MGELPHLPSGDPARPFGRREALATSRSFVWDEGCDTRHPGLEVLSREAIRGFLGVYGRGLGCPRGWVRHRSGVSSRSAHNTVLYLDNINHVVVLTVYSPTWFDTYPMPTARCKTSFTIRHSQTNSELHRQGAS